MGGFLSGLATGKPRQIEICINYKIFMWILWALVGAFGSTIWYLGPKFFPTENIFSSIFFAGIGAIFLGLLGSKFFQHTWVDGKSIPLGIALSLTYLGTVGLYLAFANGGKVGPVSVIVELSILFATIVSVFYFKEHLNGWQILGMMLTFFGIGLVVFFEK
jgi:drug/metabolite transporter (DMT)-like permease